MSDSSLLTTHYPLLTTHYQIFTAHCSPLITHHSLLTTHYSLLTNELSVAKLTERTEPPRVGNSTAIDGDRVLGGCETVWVGPFGVGGTRGRTNAGRRQGGGWGSGGMQGEGGVSCCPHAMARTRTPARPEIGVSTSLVMRSERPSWNRSFNPAARAPPPSRAITRKPNPAAAARALLEEKGKKWRGW